MSLWSRLVSYFTPRMSRTRACPAYPHLVTGEPTGTVPAMAPEAPKLPPVLTPEPPPPIIPEIPPVVIVPVPVPVVVKPKPRPRAKPKPVAVCKPATKPARRR